VDLQEVMSKFLGHYELNNCGARDFNQELLCNPGEILINPFLRLLELEDPDLAALSPLTRALYFASRPEYKQYFSAALSTIYVLDPDASARPRYESVCHQLTKSSGSADYTFEFDSHAELIWAGDDDGLEYDGQIIGTIDECIFEEVLTVKTLQEKLFELKARQKPRPMAEPVDDGEFVGIINYTLTSVNGIKLTRKPTISYSAHDLEFCSSSLASNLSYPDDSSTEFSWMTLLCEEDLRLISPQLAGVAVDILNSANPSLPGMGMLSVDEIHESYRDGALCSNVPSRVQILMGCGLEWEPSWESDNPTYETEVFSLNEPPLIDFTLNINEMSLFSSRDNSSPNTNVDIGFDILKLLIDSSLVAS